MMSTCPTVRPSTTTGTTSRLITGATSAVNQAGAGSCAAIGRADDGAASTTPAASFTAIRTWRIGRNWSGNAARNCSAETWRWKNLTASPTRSAASRIDEAISIRVCDRARTIVTLPATSIATRSMRTKTSSSWKRTERACHSAGSTPRRGSATGSAAIADAECAVMLVFPMCRGRPQRSSRQVSHGPRPTSVAVPAGYTQHYNAILRAIFGIFNRWNGRRLAHLEGLPTLMATFSGGRWRQPANSAKSRATGP